MTDLNLAEQRVMIREDLNVPMENGVITNDARIQRALPTLKKALDQGAAVIVLSHLGRPQEGRADEAYSLSPVAKALSDALACPVPLKKDWLDGVSVKPGEIVLCENVRFNQGEKANDAALAKQMAALCDVFVMDAFATAHRAEASTCGIAQYAPLACAGPLLVGELNALTRALRAPKRPVVAIVGGSKVSTKIQLLDALLDQVDQLIVGGGIANTFLKAKGHAVGQSLYEPDWVSEAARLLEKADRKGVTIPLPTDVVVAPALTPDAVGTVQPVNAIADDQCVFDVGPDTAASYPPLLEKAGTIVWNGPVGVFEYPAFSKGTAALAKSVAASSAYSIAGGGDTLAAIDQYSVADDISYISTGGGAFLAFLQGEILAAVAALQ